MNSQMKLASGREEIGTSAQSVQVPVAEKVVLRRRRVFFTGRENHLISLDDASRLTRNYRLSVPKGTMKGGYFGGEIFEKILGQEECVGIRMYFAKHSSSEPTLVLVGVEADEKDQINGLLGQDIIPCPPYCGDFNPLNSDLEVGFIKFKRQSDLFSGNENHLVTLAQASEYTRSYRESLKSGQIKGGYFSRDIFEGILGQENCVGIRVYFANLDNGAPTLVLVGVNRFGNDLYLGVVGEDIIPCPPYCGDHNPLNS